jgi:hypothetical protein
MSTTDPTPTTSPAPRSRRLARTVRRGSILILVVALVVLLALMGTAYLSSTQSERYTSQQTAVNTQVDLVLQGVDDQVRKAIVADLYDQSQQFPNGYRTPPNLRLPTASLGTSAQYGITDTYRNWDSDLTQLWLASRIPDVRDYTVVYGDTIGANNTQPTSTNLAGFDSVSWPLLPTPDVSSPGPINTSGSPTTPAALPSQAYQFYDPRTGLPVLSLGNVYSSTATYTVGDVVTDGPPTNRFYYCISSVPGTSLLNTVAWLPLDDLPKTGTTQAFQPKMSRWFEPTVLTTGGHTPALRVYSRAAGAALSASAPGNLVATIIGADADGDGIADAGYCLVPGGPINGITYYYATRVVDNAAALNASTAYNMTSDFGNASTGTSGNIALGSTQAPTGYNLGLFPSNVGLQELMFDYTLTIPNAPSADYRRVINYWCHNIQGCDNYSGPPYTDSIIPSIPSPYPRNDFTYMTQGDQWYHQLARRLDNPGLMSLGAAEAPFQPFTQADGLPLASRFCLLPPDGSDYGATNGSLVPLLPELQNSDLTYAGGKALVPVPHVPYDPANTGGFGTANRSAATPCWFDNNFNFTDDLLNNNDTNTRSPQAQVVTRNGVSNRVGGAMLPATLATSLNTTAGYTQFYDVINPGMTPYEPPVANTGTTYLPGQWIKYQQPDGAWRVYRCLQAANVVSYIPPNPLAQGFLNPAFAPLPSTVYWSPESWQPTATKTSVNTATFPELWRSFYNVMCDKWNTAPNTAPDTAPNTPAPPPTASLVPPPGSTTLTAPYRTGVAMFKSSMRTVGTAGTPPTAPATPPLSDIQMVQLRAALAAVNAMDLRDMDNDVTSRSVVLYDDPNLTGKRASVAATVFGGEKQPFITKVIVVNRQKENLQPWVAVELYNPYVQVQYPTGEAAPANANGVTFCLGTSANDPQTPASTTAPKPIYLGCRLGVLERSGGTVTITEAKDPVAGSVASFAACPPIAPGKYLVLVSDQTNVPTNVSLPIATTGSNAFLVPALAQLVNPPSTIVQAPGTVAAPNPAELVLYRTRSSTGVANALLNNLPSGNPPAATKDPMQVYNEANLWEMDPFDQFDLTQNTTLASNDSVTYLYYRPTQVTPATTTLQPSTTFDYWKCVFPIIPQAVSAPAYMPGTFAAATATPPATPPTPSTVPYGEPIAQLPATYTSTAPFPLGVGYNGTTSPTPPATGTAQAWHVIQVNNTDWPSPHTMAAGGVPTPMNIYPVAGFPRNGDLLQVPFIGAYTLSNTPLYSLTALTASPTGMLEVNSVTMDALLAEDSKAYGVTDAAAGSATGVGQADDPQNGTLRAAGSLEEQVGRFCPLMATAQPIATVTVDNDPYGWASRLFDFFTVTAPHDDYMPNADPATYAAAYAAQQTPAGTPNPLFNPVPIPNTLGASSVIQTSPSSMTPGLCPVEANAPEDGVPVQGLVNINTASWRTLSMLPLVRYTAVDGPALDGTVNVRGSAAMAQLIVTYRRLHGPYKSLFDLNKVIDPINYYSFQGATNISVTGNNGTLGDTICFTPGLDSTATTLMGPFNFTPPATPTAEATGKLVADGRQGIFTPNDPSNSGAYLYPLFNNGSGTPPTYGPNSGVYDDFQTKFLAMTRLSNLLTCRSDSFTCYVLVQGWKNGSVVSQRRSAFVLDRSPVGYQIDPVQGVRVPNVTPVSTPVSTGD